jgi:flavin-binding protein dodecin
MAFHPRGVVVEIVGDKESSCGRCEEHTVCGAAQQLDDVDCLRVIQVIISNREETAIAAYWVTDVIDHCIVGFLPRKYIKDSNI